VLRLFIQKTCYAINNFCEKTKTSQSGRPVTLLAHLEKSVQILFKGHRFHFIQIDLNITKSNGIVNTNFINLYRTLAVFTARVRATFRGGGYPQGEGLGFPSRGSWTAKPD
jgi:hypothetical protein